MDRLTQRHESGEAYVLLYASPTDNLRISKEVVDKQKMVIERLAAYEDTGLTPEEIMDGKMLTGWIPCSERLPENSKHKGAFCPKYLVNTKYGVTEGWYNPDRKSWYVLMWFMTDRCFEFDINFEKGDIPRVIRVPENTERILAWQPLPEPWEGDNE